jgi:hypothetical protein
VPWLIDTMCTWVLTADVSVGSCYSGSTAVDYPPGAVSGPIECVDYVRILLEDGEGKILVRVQVYSCTVLMHYTHTLHSYTALLHCTHTLHSYTALIHYTHTLHSYTAQGGVWWLPGCPGEEAGQYTTKQLMALQYLDCGNLIGCLGQVGQRLSTALNGSQRLSTALNGSKCCN